MSITISAIERQRVLDALDQLIAAKQKILKAAIDGINGINGEDVNKRLDKAHIEAQHAVYNLERFHPDADRLPFAMWGAHGDDLGIFADQTRLKNAGMNEEELATLKNDMIRALREYTQETIDTLQKVGSRSAKAAR